MPSSGSQRSTEADAGQLLSTLVFYILGMCVFVCTCASVSVRRLEDNMQEAGGSWVAGIELRWSGLRTKAFACWAGSPTPTLHRELKVGQHTEICIIL